MTDRTRARWMPGRASGLATIDARQAAAAAAMGIVLYDFDFTS